MKKYIFSLFFLFLLGQSVNVFALDTSARSAVLYEPVTGRVLYEKNKDEALPMASTTKIVTAITAIENGNLSDTVVTSKYAADIEGSSIWLAEGEKQSLEDLLFGLMLSSGNDAAIAIAEHVGGNIETFAGLMNQTAKNAGAAHSQFKNPNGLDQDGHYTTAEDLAKITAYAMKNPKFKEIVSTKTHTIPWEGHSWGRTLNNHNKLLKLYEGCDGVKTGFTKKSGRCLVSSATRNGCQLIAVTINAPSDWDDHTKMLDYGFTQIESQRVIDAALPLENLPVQKGVNDTVRVKYEQGLTIPVLKDDRFRTERTMARDLEAPLKEGEVVGWETVYLNDQEVGKVNIITSEGAEKLYVPSFWDRLRQVFACLVN